MDFEDELNPNNYSYPHFEDGNEQITQNLARLLADTTASSTFDLTSGAVGTSALPSFISPTDSTGSPYLSVGGHDDDLSGSAMFGSSLKLPTSASLPATSKAKGKRKAKTQGEPKRASKKVKASARVPEPVGDVSLDVPLPNVGRVRLDKRSATSRTRSLDRPAIPTWLQETGVSEQRRAEIDAVVMAAATPEYTNSLWRKAGREREGFKKARELLAVDLFNAQVEEAILKNLRDMVSAEMRKIEQELHLVP